MSYGLVPLWELIRLNHVVTRFKWNFEILVSFSYMERTNLVRIERFFNLNAKSKPTTKLSLHPILPGNTAGTSGFIASLSNSSFSFSNSSTTSSPAKASLIDNSCLLAWPSPPTPPSPSSSPSPTSDFLCELPSLPDPMNEVVAMVLGWEWSLESSCLDWSLEAYKEREEEGEV